MYEVHLFDQTNNDDFLREIESVFRKKNCTHRKSQRRRKLSGALLCEGPRKTKFLSSSQQFPISLGRIVFPKCWEKCDVPYIPAISHWSLMCSEFSWLLFFETCEVLNEARSHFYFHYNDHQRLEKILQGNRIRKLVEMNAKILSIFIFRHFPIYRIDCHRKISPNGFYFHYWQKAMKIL